MNLNFDHDELGIIFRQCLDLEIRAHLQLITYISYQLFTFRGLTFVHFKVISLMYVLYYLAFTFFPHFLRLGDGDLTT